MLTTLLMSTVLLIAQDTPSWVPGYLERCDRGRLVAADKADEARKEFQNSIRMAKRGRINGRQAEPVEVNRTKSTVFYTFKSADDKADYLLKLDGYVDRADRLAKGFRDGTIPYFAELEHEVPTVGDVGRLHRKSIETDDGDTIEYVGRIVQIADENNMLVKLGAADVLDDGELVWMSGIPTGKLFDDRPIVLNEVFVVSGSKSYGTAAGATKTVPLLEAVDMTPFLKK